MNITGVTSLHDYFYVHSYISGHSQHTTTGVHS